MYRSEYGHTVSPPDRSVGMVGGGGQQVMYRFANDRVAFVRDRLGEGARGAQQKKGKAATFDEQRRKRALLRKKLRLEQQAAQPQGTNYWTTHEGKGHVVPTERIYPEGFKGQMYPAGAAANHPAAPELRRWVTEGCPVDTGPRWTMEQIKTALERGPHLSAMKPDAMRAFKDEVASKLENNQVRIISWDDVKHDPPSELKLSPMA